MPSSDDVSHDEAVSSRIAILNMLDLGLEHLGVDVGTVGNEVTIILKDCGASKCGNVSKHSMIETNSWS